MERGFSRHPIDDNQDKGIVVRLGMQSIINHFRLLLWDRDNRYNKYVCLILNNFYKCILAFPCRAYSYYIDVSMDQKDWVRVIDHRKHHCRSWQELYFPPRVVRYIRIVGTYNSVNKVFHAVSLEAYYTNTPFQLDKNGILSKRQT